MRKVQTRQGTRQHFYHQTQGNGSQILTKSNDIIRPPTSHPYSGYKSKKSQSQMRAKYCPNYFIESRLQTYLKQVKSNNQSYMCIERLPHNFRLAINQLKAMMKNVLGPCKPNPTANPSSSTPKTQLTRNCETDFNQLLQNLAKLINDLVNQRNQLLVNKEEKEKNIEFLSSKISELEKKIYKNQESFTDDRQKYMYICGRKNGKKMQVPLQIQKQLLLQNCRLGQLNQRYLSRISQLQSRQSQSLTSTPSCHPQACTPNNQPKIDTELIKCKRRIDYLQTKLNTAERVENELLMRNQKMDEDGRDLRSKIDRLQQQYRSVCERLAEWRQRALMQKEDGEIHIARQQFLLYSLKKLKQNNKNLMNKLLNNNIKSDEKMSKKDYTQNTNFQYQQDILKSIRTNYQKSPQFSPNSLKPELGLQIEEPSLQSDYRMYKQSDSFDVSGLRLYRPSFFSFLEEAASPDLLQCRSKGGNVSRVFVQVMRAIMLSKQNQFMYGQFAGFSRFPEFVYGWFEKFYFSTQKNIVCTLQPFMQKPINQQTFYHTLMNPKMDQNWQTITFRQFLLEQLTLQQLYFYLMCQMLLYSRSGITKEVQYQGDFCILVEYGAAKSVLDITLNDFESWNVAFLAGKLREKVVTRGGKQVVEAGFFLRCLLEYYKIQRSNRYRYISKLCSEFTGHNTLIPQPIPNASTPAAMQRKNLRFSSFMSIINKFTQISTDTKLKLYRDCFCLTRGNITPQSIFIICSEELIFLRCLKMKSFYRLPKIVSKPVRVTGGSQNGDNHAGNKTNKNIICLQPSDPYLYDIILSFTRVLSSPSNQLSTSSQHPTSIHTSSNLNSLQTQPNLPHQQNSRHSTANSSHNQNNLLKRIETLGVSQFVHQISSINKALDERNSELGSNVMKCKHFLHYFSNAIEIVRNMTYYNFYELLEQQSKKKTSSFWIPISDQDLGSIFAQQIQTTFSTYEKINQLRIWKDKVYQFRLNNAAKKIQKQVKKKFIEPYMQLYNYFKNQVSNGVVNGSCQIKVQGEGSNNNVIGKDHHYGSKK